MINVQTERQPTITALKISQGLNASFHKLTRQGPVPDELLESARMDGAGEFRTFFQVSLKLLTPSVVTIFLFQFIGIWNNFFLPMVMLQSQNLYPITLGLFNWNAAIDHYPGLQESIITGSLVSIIPLVLVFLLLQRYWKVGLTSGSLD